MTNILKGKWVFDSNLLIFILDRNSPFYPRTKEIFQLVEKNIIQPVVTVQNIIETENIFLKKYKLPQEDLIDKMENMLQSCNMIIISPFITTYKRFHELISNGKIKNKDIFDYFLAATMLDNNISRILTGNSKDFEGIEGIEAVNPFL